MISKKSKLADIVNRHSELLNVLRRLGIKLGFADKTVGEVCEQYGVNSDFFIELATLVVDPGDFNPKYIENFTTAPTIEYLRRSHEAYGRENLPEIESSIAALERGESSRREEASALRMFFENYRKEAIRHFQYEDGVVFPYILRIESGFTGAESAENLARLIPESSIVNYIKMHNPLDEQLDDLKNLLIKYFKPFEDARTSQALLQSLFEMERDLKNHELIENQILFPQVLRMERYILERGEAGK
ncbi:MAG: hypothetical protein ACM3U1_06760 [Chloroflexota bacterium]